MILSAGFVLAAVFLYSLCPLLLVDATGFPERASVEIPCFQQLIHFGQQRRWEDVFWSLDGRVGIGQNLQQR